MDQIQGFFFALIGGVFLTYLMTIYFILTMEYEDYETKASRKAKADRQAECADELDRSEVRRVRIIGIPGI